MVTSFDRDDIVAALDELATLLVRSGASAQIRIVGPPSRSTSPGTRRPSTSTPSTARPPTSPEPSPRSPR
jgi:hypothetical protein